MRVSIPNDKLAFKLTDANGNSIDNPLVPVIWSLLVRGAFPRVKNKRSIFRGLDEDDLTLNDLVLISDNGGTVHGTNLWIRLQNDAALDQPSPFTDENGNPITWRNVGPVTNHPKNNRVFVALPNDDFGPIAQLIKNGETIFDADRMRRILDNNEPV